MPINKTPLTDESPMTFGKWKGTPMKEVPPDYLQWLSGQPWIPDWPAVNAYLRKNIDVINLEAEEALGASEDEEEGYSSYEDYERDNKRN